MIEFDESSEPNADGWIQVLVLDEGGTNVGALRAAIIERYKGKEIYWRSLPEAYDQKLFEGGTRLWCAARLAVK